MDRIVWVGDVRCVRLSTPFSLHGEVFPNGSWLVHGPADLYARALTAAAFDAWWAAAHE